MYFLYPCEFTVQTPCATWLDFLIAWTEESKRPSTEVKERKPWSLTMISFKYTHTLQAKGGLCIWKKNISTEIQEPWGLFVDFSCHFRMKANTRKGYKKWKAGNLELHSSELSAFASVSVWSSFYTLWPCYLFDFLSLCPPNTLLIICSTAMALFYISKCVARLEIPVNWTEKSTSSWIERTFSPDLKEVFFFT